jgi:4-hydroxybenzoate polyprenyltransferase
MHILCIICFALVGIILHLGAIYFLGVAIATATLIYQRSIVTPKDFSQITQAYFMRNGIVSVAILICTWLNYF